MWRLYKDDIDKIPAAFKEEAAVVHQVSLTDEEREKNPELAAIIDSCHEFIVRKGNPDVFGEAYFVIGINWLAEEKVYCPALLVFLSEWIYGEADFGPYYFSNFKPWLDYPEVVAIANHLAKGYPAFLIQSPNSALYVSPEVFTKYEYLE